ncbi:hypothetical protein NMY22_g971 [Coprinellus aureogranulatus]|nr:hypothetical protein NMY22_g971 [Coprinellus aureogranulatus]
MFSSQIFEARYRPVPGETVREEKVSPTPPPGSRAVNDLPLQLNFGFELQTVAWPALDLLQCEKPKVLQLGIPESGNCQQIGL